MKQKKLKKFLILIIFIIILSFRNVKAITIIGDEPTILNYIIFVIPIILVIITFIMIRYSKKTEQNILEKKSNTRLVNNPPEGLNSLEVSYLCKNKVNKQDIISLFLVLLNKDYIRIENFDNEKFKIINQFKNINNQVERDYYDGFFEYEEEEEDPISEVTIEKNTKQYIDEDNYNKRLEYKKVKVLKSNVVFWLALFSAFITIVYPLLLLSNNYDIEFMFGGRIIDIIMFSILEIASFICLYKVISLKTNKNIHNSNKAGVYGLIIISLFGFYLLYLFTMMKIYELPILLVLFVINTICTIILFVLSSKTYVISSNGKHILNQILEFKAYLENIDIKELRDRVSNDSMFFYNMLPYAYSFGFFDKYIEKINEIEIRQPSWYISSKDFNKQEFVSFMKNVMLILEGKNEE